MTTKTDPLTPELRAVERQLDNAYRSNFLLTLNFAQAAWYLLACAEYIGLAPIISNGHLSPHHLNAHADRITTHIQYPLRWLYETCPPNGEIKTHNEEITGQAAADLFELASSYKSVVAVFTFATKGMIDLKIDGNQIVVNHNFFTDTRYEAYNRLLKPSEVREQIDFLTIGDLVIKNIRVSGDRFNYKVTPQIVARVKEVLRPYYEDSFTLPLSWHFTRYTIGQYLEFAITLGALMVIHWCARYFASVGGCDGYGYRDSVKIYDTTELVNRITRYSGLDAMVVKEIIGDLTYGNRGIKKPDPALQPVILLTQNKYALSPWLWITNAIERNFTVLVNRIPAERQIYAQLVKEKESVMRTQVIEALRENPYRFVNGDLGQGQILTDIDLAVVSDAEKACLIMEMKWFIDPAEIGEVVEKTEDLQKGVTQMNKMRKLFDDGLPSLLSKLGIDQTYRVCFIVVSANWIGHEDVQTINVPIINQMHLSQKIRSTASLLSVIEWLNNRKYLPTEGVDYEIRDDIVKIDSWVLKWYGIKPLIEDIFLPL